MFLFFLVFDMEGIWRTFGSPLRFSHRLNTAVCLSEKRKTYVGAEVNVRQVNFAFLSWKKPLSRRGDTL